MICQFKFNKIKLMILNINDVSLSFGDKTILNNISFLINEGDKCALIGDNGTGKSSLLKLITGEYTKDSGEITFKKDISIGYVAQNQDFESQKTSAAFIFNNHIFFLKIY